ncbi:hypothetical protein HPB47_013485 [Ixodes persulcatus]|uniref:Uncharacterized protein n=1 Tax=Ixodes persulcatus TaxID=34615 RepID=A0AC60R1X2_IXOPE|nr:hypothetical protein HPB47_013485 [Ixodes persulcatus]
MFAYARYKDKHRALVPITLIKQFKPTDVDDFDPEKVKMVFWKTKDGTLAGHYKANVIMLGETEDLLLRAMIKQKLAIPSIIYDDRVEQPPEVDLGDGLFMMAAQFNHCVKKSATDSKMVRNTALALRTHKELLVQSVTGNPSRRFLKECPEGTKQPITPKKLKIVWAALRAYIGNRLEEEVDARLAKTNAYLATYVQDTCTRWKRAQRKKSQEAAAEAEEMAILSTLSPLQRPTSPSGTAE